MTARIVKLIVSDDLRRGKGVEGDPVRIVPRLYTLDGRFVVEVDPEIDPHHERDAHLLGELARNGGA